MEDRYADSVKKFRNIVFQRCTSANETFQLASQSVETPEELLPGFASGDFAPKIRLPSLPVPEVKEILPTCIGAERKTEGGTGKAAGRQHAGILKKVFPGNDIWNGKQGVAL